MATRTVDVSKRMASRAAASRAPSANGAPTPPPVPPAVYQAAEAVRLLHAYFADIVADGGEITPAAFTVRLALPFGSIELTVAECGEPTPELFEVRYIDLHNGVGTRVEAVQGE